MPGEPFLPVYHDYLTKPRICACPLVDPRLVHHSLFPETSQQPGERSLWSPALTGFLPAEAVTDRALEAWEVAFDDVEYPLEVDPEVLVGDQVAQPSDV